MATTPDLTIAQIHAKCINPVVAEYIASMATLPIDISVCEFLAIFLQSAASAQVTANNANADAKVGDRLNTYLLPLTSAVTTDTNLNVQFYTAMYKLNVVIGVNAKISIVPAYS